MQDEKNIVIEDQYLELEDSNQEYDFLVDSDENEEPICVISCNVGDVLNAIAACFKSKSKIIYNKNIIFINTKKKNNTLFFVRHNNDFKITEIPFIFSDNTDRNVDIIYGISDEFINSLEKRLSLEDYNSKVDFKFYDDRIAFIVNQSYYESGISREEAVYEDHISSYEEYGYVHVPIRFDILDNFIQSLNVEKDLSITFLSEYVVINAKNNRVSIYGGNRSFISKIDINLEENGNYNDVLMLFKKTILSDIVDYNDCKLMYNSDKNLTKITYSKDNLVFTGYYTNVPLDGTVDKIVQMADEDSDDGELIFEIVSDCHNILDFVSKLDKATKGNIFNINKHSDTFIEISIKGIYGDSILFKERILSIVKKDFTIMTSKNVIESIAKVMKNMKNAVLSFYMRPNSMVVIKSHAGFEGYDFKSIFMTVKV